jgi:hypothetical protein
MKIKIYFLIIFKCANWNRENRYVKVKFVCFDNRIVVFA